MARGPFWIVGLLVAVAALFVWWTEPRVALVGVDERGAFRGALVNTGRTRVLAVLCDGAPRSAATCDCARLAEAVLAPGERLAVTGAAVSRPRPCGVRP